jgi:NAD(P) transhydrogenase subunit alpha
VVPKSLPKLLAAGLDVQVETGAGIGSGVTDAEYAAGGATVAARGEALGHADVVLTVRGLGRDPSRADEDLAVLPATAVVSGLLEPFGAGAGAVRRLADRGVTAFSLELIPRITRAQEMDALSSMSSIAGYQAVVRAATLLPKMFPLMMTAAGTVSPARVLVVGAGVAGLQAVATAQRLGAVVEAFDVRPEVREQVESLGARFVDSGVDARGEGGYAKEVEGDAARRLEDVLGDRVAGSDVVITTALIPGRPAPVLVTAEMVGSMKPGSVIVDLAAEAGGNCALTRPGEETVTANAVLIDGPLNVPSMKSVDASRLYSHNITRFTLELVKDGRVSIDLQDAILGPACVALGGRVLRGPAVVAAEETA